MVANIKSLFGDAKALSKLGLNVGGAVPTFYGTETAMRLVQQCMCPIVFVVLFHCIVMLCVLELKFKTIYNEAANGGVHPGVDSEEEICARITSLALHMPLALDSLAMIEQVT